jgi:hypothetical protein
MARLVGNRCVADEALSLELAASSIAPSFDATGSLHVIESNGVALVHHTYNGGALLSSSVVQGYPPTCDYSEQLSDAAFLGWLVVLAWAAAWGVRVLARAL